MAVNIEDRPTDKVREEVVDQLIMNYSHGELSHEAFERRLDCAMESNCNKEIIALVDDLELSVDKAYIDNKIEGLGYSYTPGITEECETMVNVFSGSERSGLWKVPKNIRSFSLFSGSDIDFSEAKFSHPQVRLKIFSLFSGNDVYVPENVNVVTKAFCIFGGIDNKAPSNADESAPTIIIEGFIVFSGIDITIKKTLKERFVSFADGLKKMFN